MKTIEGKNEAVQHLLKIPCSKGTRIPCVVLLSAASQRDSGLRNGAV